MARPVAKALVAFAVVAGALVVGVVWFVSSQSAPAVRPFPNGYDDLLKAGHMLEADVDYTTMADEELRAAVGKNAEALALTKKALDRESQVRLDYSATSAAHLNDLSLIKRLAQALIAEGKLAEIDHHPHEAAQAYLNAIRLGHHAEAGGVIIDSMVAVAVEAIGTSALEELTPQLNAAECREVAAGLQAVESGREPTGAILAQERAWARRTYGFKGALIRLLTFKQLQAGEQRWAARRKAQVTRTQGLLLRLATNADAHGSN